MRARLHLHQGGCRRRARHRALHHRPLPRGSHCSPQPSHSTLVLTAPQRLRQRRVSSCSRGRVRSSTCPALLAAGTQSRRKSGACSPPPSTKAVKALGGPNPDHARGPAARLWHAPCHGRRCSFPSSTWSQRPRSRNHSRCYRSACLRVNLRLACQRPC
jgi:hypothetical protein